MIQILGDMFNFIMTKGDQRTFSLPLANPWWPFYTFFVYVLLVKVIGPRYMKNRQPYVLTNALLVYNAFQVALSLYLFILMSQHGWLSIPNWFKCKPIEENSTPEFQHLLFGHHLYYISKFTELLDTVFFVLRKKYNQISFLHVYHHGTMPFFTCLTLRFSPGSSVSFIGFLNCLVHVVMYGYYLLAALGPSVQKYLWWKKYITSMQLIQFIILFFHFLIVLGSNCNIPLGIALFLPTNIVVNFALFYHFYRKEYKQKMKVSKSKAEKSKVELNGFIENPVKMNGFSNEVPLENIKNRGHS